MGWMLWPTGVGWKARSRTARTGSFTCRNPRCKGKKSSSIQQYKLQQHRNWIVVFYIPIVPMNHLGASLQCASCKSYYSLDVLTEDELRELAGEVSAPSVALPGPPAEIEIAAEPACPRALEVSALAGPSSLTCVQCGAVVAEDGAFCSRCGHPVDRADAVVGADTADEPEDDLAGLFGVVEATEPGRAGADSDNGAPAPGS